MAQLEDRLLCLAAQLRDLRYRHCLAATVKFFHVYDAGGLSH